MRSTHERIISVIQYLNENNQDTSIDALVKILPYRRKDTLAYISHLTAYDYIYPDEKRKFHVHDAYKHIRKR
jgi:DNA-binding IclR family transcriptional regulator